MEQKHILIVDDISTNLKYAEAVLKSNYKLSMAKSGKETLEILKEVRPDLILLDVKMPEMDGYETLQNIRKMPEYTDIPIVFLTGDVDNKSEIKGLKLGAMDFIRKPFEPEIVLRRIEKILRMEETKRKLEVSASKDALTGLWNRMYLEKAINQYGQCENSGVFVLFDMDDFKRINDCYGHVIGDAVLIQFASALKASVKHSDVVCRLGGDEFALFLKDKMSSKDVEEKMRACLSEIEVATKMVNDEEISATVSAGVAMMPEDGIDFMTLYTKADKALYHVKQNGKSGFHLFHDKGSYTFCSNK